MQVRQIRLDKMQVFCYAIADETTGSCLLVDPAFEPRKIVELVQGEGYRITEVVNTHGHSDHTAGNAYVKTTTGANLLIHELDAARLTGMANRALSRLLGGRGSPGPDSMLKDGDLIQLGQSSLRVIHTPGHTPGSICLYAPGHLFTGDTLFVGGVGRTDLPGGSIEQLRGSIRERIYSLDPETVVWPGHDYGPRPSSTVGREKQSNPYA